MPTYDREPNTPKEALDLMTQLLTSLALDLQEVAGRLSKLALLVAQWAEQQERT